MLILGIMKTGDSYTPILIVRSLSKKICTSVPWREWITLSRFAAFIRIGVQQKNDSKQNINRVTTGFINYDYTELNYGFN